MPFWLFLTNLLIIFILCVQSLAFHFLEEEELKFRSLNCAIIMLAILGVILVL